MSSTLTHCGLLVEAMTAMRLVLFFAVMTTMPGPRTMQTLFLPAELVAGLPVDLIGLPAAVAAIPFHRNVHTIAVHLILEEFIAAPDTPLPEIALAGWMPEHDGCQIASVPVLLVAAKLHVAMIFYLRVALGHR